MVDCMDAGFHAEECTRTASGCADEHTDCINELMLREDSDTHADFMDWLNVTGAIAVNEGNAGGGRVVTAPTNGAGAGDRARGDAQGAAVLARDG